MVLFSEQLIASMSLVGTSVRAINTDKKNSLKERILDQAQVSYCFYVEKISQQWNQQTKFNIEEKHLWKISHQDMRLVR